LAGESRHQICQRFSLSGAFDSGVGLYQRERLAIGGDIWLHRPISISAGPAPGWTYTVLLEEVVNGDTEDQGELEQTPRTDAVCAAFVPLNLLVGDA
jgi:hypothetical protein